jgi:hypothetical protein
MIDEEKIYEKLIRKLERIERKMVASIGAEFEGGICSENIEILEDNYDTSRLEVGYDGSVNVSKPSNIRCHWLSDTEIRYWSEDPREMIDFARDLWSLGFRQNHTC